MIVPGASSWTWPRTIAWGLTAAVVFAVVGPTYIRAFLPPEGAYTDFLQEWLSARNYFSGSPIYREVPASIQEHMPERRRADGSAPAIAFTDPATGSVIAEMKYNAHPPVAVMVAAPFAKLDYPNAHLVWNLLTYALFLAAIAAVVCELEIPFRWPSLFPALILLLGNPVLNQVYQGQLNCLLAALITTAWILDRRGHSALAGVAVGLAGALKLYPLFLLIYFAFTRRWLGLATLVAAFLISNGIAAAVFGAGAFRDYADEVVPAIAGQFQSAWVNVSLSGFWLRLFGSEPLRDWMGASPVSSTGRVLAGGVSLVVTGLVARVCWRAATRDDRDRAFALTAVVMLLVSPITWSHYYLLLLVPLGLLWMRGSSGLSSWVTGAVLAVLWLPPDFAAQLWLGRDGVATFNEYHHPRLTVAEDLGIVSVPHYALLGLFLLSLRLPHRTDVTDAAVDNGLTPKTHASD